MPMSLSTLRASAPLCHLDTCGNVLFACLLHQILSASGAGAESVSVLPPRGCDGARFREREMFVQRVSTLHICVFSLGGRALPAGTCFCAHDSWRKVRVWPTPGPLPWLFSLLGSLPPSSRSLFKRHLLQAPFPDPLKWPFSASRSPSHSLLGHLRSSTSEIIFFNSHGHRLSPHRCVGPARAGA